MLGQLCSLWDGVPTWYNLRDPIPIGAGAVSATLEPLNSVVSISDYPLQDQCSGNFVYPRVVSLPGVNPSVALHTRTTLAWPLSQKTISFL